jgi:hypothetical protein
MHNIFCYTDDVNNINERNTMMHGTTDTAQLGGNPADLPTLPPIVRQPRTAVKRWTVRTVGTPTITTAVLAEAKTKIAALRRT